MSGRSALAAALAIALGLTPGCRTPPAPFEEVTATAGLGGPVPCYDVALADFDADGRLDFYAPNHATGAVLYRNRGDLRFEDATAASGIDPGGDQHGCGWGDADGDGRPDLYVSLGADHGRAVKANRLYQNVGGRFASLEAAAGAADPRGRGRGVTWVDYDRDGHLDVFVANFKTPNALFRNRGDGTFEERAAAAGLDRPATVHVVWTDYDADGWPDVLFLPSLTGIRLLRNRGDGTFDDATKEARLPRWPPIMGAAFGDLDGDGDLDLVLGNGVDYPTGLSERDGVVAFSQLRPKPGVALVFETSVATPPLRLVEQDTPIAADDPRLVLRVEGPGRRELRWRGEHALTGRIGPGAHAARLVGVRPWRSRRPSRLFLNQGNGRFLPSDALSRIGPRGNAQAVVLGDVDNDGDLDVFAVMSGVEGADEPDALYLNDGRGSFMATKPIPASEDRNAGARLADLDGDGRLDLLLSGGWGSSLTRARHRVFRNVAPTAHWLELRLVGRRSNRPGLGTRVTIVAGERRQTRYLSGGGLYAQDLVPLHVGLGSVDSPVEVTLHWPSGMIERRIVRVDGVHTLVEGELPQD